MPFVHYGNCYSGVPGTLLERNFASINATVARLSPQPEFIVFAGDHVMGGTPNIQDPRKRYRATRRTWDW